MKETEVSFKKNYLSNNEKGYKELEVLTWSDLMLFLFYFFSMGIIIGVIAKIIEINANVNTAETIKTSYFGVFEAIFLLIGLYTFKSMRTFTLKIIDFTVFRYFRTYLYIFAGFLSSLLIQYLLVEVLKIDNPSKQESYIDINQLTNWAQYTVFFISVVILSPIKEEFLHRGIIYRFFEVKYPKYGIWIGLVISSAFFGVIHPGIQVSAILIGIILIILYRLTKSIIPSIILHILLNLLVFILLVI